MAELSIPNLHEATQELIGSYHDVNGPIHEFQDEAPISVYAQHVRQNRPFVIRGGCSAWNAMQWDGRRLKERMNGRTVKVAETPFGYGQTHDDVSDGC